MASDEPINRYFLFPGTLFADSREYQISTVLGSCVTVCLWDRVSHRGGMNHFMLPLWNGDGLATPKYGNIAMEKLLAKVYSIGCRHDCLVAKVFGGANIMDTGHEPLMIGDRNIALAFDMLGEFRIPVIAHDVGGRVGRKIIMNTASGVVFVGKGKPVSARSRCE